MRRRSCVHIRGRRSPRYLSRRTLSSEFPTLMDARPQALRRSTRRRVPGVARTRVARGIHEVSVENHGQCAWTGWLQELSLHGRRVNVIFAQGRPMVPLVTKARFLPDDDPRHGTPNGYANLGCRCDLCRAANTDYAREYMRRVRSEHRLLGSHPSALAYNCGCRCDPCREAHNERSRESKRRRRIVSGGS